MEVVSVLSETTQGASAVSERVPGVFIEMTGEKDSVVISLPNFRTGGEIGTRRDLQTFYLEIPLTREGDVQREVNTVHSSVRALARRPTSYCIIFACRVCSLHDVPQFQTVTSA